MWRGGTAAKPLREETCSDGGQSIGEAAWRDDWKVIRRGAWRDGGHVVGNGAWREGRKAIEGTDFGRTAGTSQSESR